MLSTCIFSSDNKRRTKHIARTLNPEWKETITFPNVHAEEMRNKTLEITVWDYDRFKANDFLGEVVLNLSGISYFYNIATLPGIHHLSSINC